MTLTMLRLRRKRYRPIKKLAVRQGRRRSPPLTKGEFVKKTVLTAFLLAGAIWIIYFFFASDNFSVKTVKINGLKNIPRAELENIAAARLNQRHVLLFSGKNILLFSNNDLRRDIAKKYVLDDLQIKKKLPHSLLINIREKQARLLLRAVTKVRIEEQRQRPAYIGGAVAGESANGGIAGNEPQPACQGETKCEEKKLPPEPAFTVSIAYFYLDANGIVVSAEPALKESKAPDFPVVEMELNDQTLVKPGDTVLKNEQVSYVFSLYEQAAGSRSKPTIAYLIYDPKAPDEMKLATSEGWQIFLSQKISLETQFNKLDLALSEKIKERRRYLQYVDLRVKDRVYYK